MWNGMGWDDCLVAKETRDNDANDANNNICIRVRRVWFGCAPQPSAAGECMMDVPMGAYVWEEVEELRERGLIICMGISRIAMYQYKGTRSQTCL
jgi:hypothetical protein